MRRVLVVLLLGLIAANPGWAQSPCPPETRIPLSIQVVQPICPGQPLRLRAEACGPCVDLLEWSPGPPLQIKAFMDRSNCLVRACLPETLDTTLGTVSPGHYQLLIQVNGTVAGPESTFCTVVRYDSVTFDVPQRCGIHPGPLPHTDVIEIGPPPICPGRDIPFRIAGTFPNTCYEFRGLELLPSPIASPLPQPPIARVHVARRECPNETCALVPVPWEARAMLPGLLGGDYRMIVELSEVGLCDSTIHSDTLYSTVVPFTVAVDCSLPPQEHCYLQSWRRDSAETNCDARVGPGTPARLVFQISTCEPIAGLQGKFVLRPSDLRIADLQPIGQAAGMRLIWEETPEGASFVMFAGQGAPIGSLPCELRFFTGDPVLEVFVEPRSGVPIPAVTTLEAVELLASDSLGREIPPCPTLALVLMAPARICSGRSCDYNTDGRVDVRDLVQMVHCMQGLDRCIGLDCNADGTFNVDDVLCCARVILHGRMPDSTAARPAPEVRVDLGASVRTASGLDVPVRLHGADLVGAARLAFDYPADRFDHADVELLGNAADWLEVSETEDGKMIVGLIASAPAAEIARALDFVLHFRLAPGRQPLQSIRLAEAEFAGPDGVALATSTPNASVPPKLLFELSVARPNPFTRETRFELDVSRATDTDLGVFDLSGRRVATLHQGRLEAGPHTFRWDGTRSDGTRARNGVYFYRAQGSGAHAARKLVLVGE